jgi:hypothetical protein
MEPANSEKVCLPALTAATPDTAIYGPDPALGGMEIIPSPEAYILVADDDAAVRGFLRTVLKRGGYKVIEAANGREALRQARATPVALVITDLVMPEQEGIETIQLLRRELPQIGIIAISGAFGGQLLRAAKALGANAILEKPFNPELLLAMVKAVLLRQP